MKALLHKIFSRYQHAGVALCTVMLFFAVANLIPSIKDSRGRTAAQNSMELEAEQAESKGDRLNAALKWIKLGDLQARNGLRPDSSASYAHAYELLKDAPIKFFNAGNYRNAEIAAQAMLLLEMRLAHNDSDAKHTAQAVLQKIYERAEASGAPR